MILDEETKEPCHKLLVFQPGQVFLEICGRIYQTKASQMSSAVLPGYAVVKGCSSVVTRVNACDLK